MFLLPLLAVIVSCAQGAPTVDKSKYTALAPPEVRNYLASLTAEEKTILKELMKNHAASSKTQQELFDKIKQKSEILHKKSVQVFTTLTGKAESLKGKAKDYAKDYVRDSFLLLASHLVGTPLSADDLKAAAESYVTRYHALTNSEKTEFASKFPEVGKALGDYKL